MTQERRCGDSPTPATQALVSNNGPDAFLEPPPYESLGFPPHITNDTQDLRIGLEGMPCSSVFRAFIHRRRRKQYRNQKWTSWTLLWPPSRIWSAQSLAAFQLGFSPLSDVNAHSTKQ